MLDLYTIKKGLIPVVVTGILNDGESTDGYLFQDKFVMKNLGQLNERLFYMLMLNIEPSMKVTGRNVYDLKVYPIPSDGITIGQWFYIKEE